MNVLFVKEDGSKYEIISGLVLSIGDIVVCYAGCKEWSI